MENKYAKMNIVDADFDDICYEFEQKRITDNKTYGLVSNRESVEYLLTDYCLCSDANIELVYFDNASDKADDLYYISINSDGNIVVFPLSETDDLLGINVVYLDMDCVPQHIIDYCVYNDMNVTLFGAVDDENEDDFYCDDCDEREWCDYEDELDKSMHLDLYQDDNGKNFGFTSYKSTDRGNIIFSYYSNSSLDYSDIVDILSEINF